MTDLLLGSLIVIAMAWIPAAVYIILMKVLYSRAGAAFDMATDAYIEGDLKDGRRWSAIGQQRKAIAQRWNIWAREVGP